MIGDDGQISSDGTRMHGGGFCSSSSQALSPFSSIDGDNGGTGGEARRGTLSSLFIRCAMAAARRHLDEATAADGDAPPSPLL